MSTNEHSVAVATIVAAEPTSGSATGAATRRLPARGSRHPRADRRDRYWEVHRVMKITRVVPFLLGTPWSTLAFVRVDTDRPGFHGDSDHWVSGGHCGRLKALMAILLELGRRDVAAGGVEATGAPEVNDAPAEGVDDKRRVAGAGAGPDVRQVSDPEPVVGSRGGEYPLANYASAVSRSQRSPAARVGRWNGRPRGWHGRPTRSAPPVR
jgi:hypothetical protein